MAAAFGAPPPRRLPGWLLRLAAPYVASIVVDSALRVSNAKATAELGWRAVVPHLRRGQSEPWRRSDDRSARSWTALGRAYTLASDEGAG